MKINPILFFASLLGGDSFRLRITRGAPAPSYFKRKNQRQRRKAARARHAAGFKNAF